MIDELEEQLEAAATTMSDNDRRRLLEILAIRPNSITRVSDKPTELSVLIDVVCGASLATQDIARLAAKIGPALPPRDRRHQDELVRRYVSKYLPASESRRVFHRAFLAAVAEFERNAESRSALRKTVCSFATDERRALLWSILAAGRPSAVDSQNAVMRRKSPGTPSMVSGLA